MKKLNILLFLIIISMAQAQVAIDKESFRSQGSILEFKDMAEGGPARGIILPILEDTSKVTEGALFIDANTKKVICKEKNGEIELTLSSNQTLKNRNNENASVIISGTGSSTAGVIISDGSVSTNAPAILKLDSNKAALLLPHINDVTKDIVNPEAGTIAYDVKSKSLAIFNGSYWYFWN